MFYTCPQCRRVYKDLPEACACGLIFSGVREATEEERGLFFPGPKPIRKQKKKKKAAAKKETADVRILKENEYLSSNPLPELKLDGAPYPPPKAPSDEELWASLEVAFGETSNGRGLIILDDDDVACESRIESQDQEVGGLRRLELL